MTLIFRHKKELHEEAVVKTSANSRRRSLSSNRKGAKRESESSRKSLRIHDERGKEKKSREVAIPSRAFLKESLFEGKKALKKIIRSKISVDVKKDKIRFGCRGTASPSAKIGAGSHEAVFARGQGGDTARKDQRVRAK